jgi:hypothetical protein
MAFIRQQASLAHEYKTNITCFWSITNWVCLGNWR